MGASVWLSTDTDTDLIYFGNNNKFTTQDTIIGAVNLTNLE